MDRAKGKCGVSTKITRPNTTRHFPVGCSNECCLHLKCEIENACAATPFANNTQRVLIWCTSLSTMHCCWWWTFWTFVTSNVKISQFYLDLYVNYEHSKCVYFFGHSVFHHEKQSCSTSSQWSERLSGRYTDSTTIQAVLQGHTVSRDCTINLTSLMKQVPGSICDTSFF
jgi:hypothetical protein